MRYLFFFTAIFFITETYAFKLTPMSTGLNLKDSKSLTFLLENDSKEPLPVQVSVTTRSIEEDGKEIQKPTTELTIFPEQLIIPPEQKRSVKVTWSDPENINFTNEKSYRVIAEQVPVDLKKKKAKSGIKMLLKYIAALYITNGDVESKVEARVENSTKDNMVLVIENKGTGHQLLTLDRIELTDKKEKINWKKDELKGILGENILAQSLRRVTVGHQKGTEKLVTPIKAKLVFE